MLPIQVTNEAIRSTCQHHKFPLSTDCAEATGGRETLDRGSKGLIPYHRASRRQRDTYSRYTERTAASVRFHARRIWAWLRWW